MSNSTKERGSIDYAAIARRVLDRRPKDSMNENTEAEWLAYGYLALAREVKGPEREATLCEYCKRIHDPRIGCPEYAKRTESAP